MKLLVVACLSLVGCCYAGLLPGGSAVSAASDFGKAGKDAIQLRNKASDWASGASSANQWANAARDHGRSNSGFDTGASRDAEKNEAANSGYGTVQSNKDLSNSVNNRNAEKASSASAQQNRWADKNDANRFLNDQIWSQGNQWYNGKRNNDNIDYAYDKKFDLRDSENGGYEFALNKNSHALDDYHDKSSAYDRNVDKHAAAVAAADAQSADRKTASTQWSKAADANADKFARNQDSGAWANGRNKDYAQKLDSTQGGDRVWADARKSASDIYNDLSSSDSVYDRRNKAFGAKEGAGGVGTNAYGYGIAAPSAYAYKPQYYNTYGGAPIGGSGPVGGAAGIVGGGFGGAGAGGAAVNGGGATGGFAAGAAGVNGFGGADGVSFVDHAKAAGGVDLAKVWDQAAAAKQRASDTALTEDKTKTHFQNDQWLNDRVSGFDRDQKAHNNDAGFSDWAQSSARDAAASDAARADAASKASKEQAVSNFNEDVWAKENEKKVIADRDQNEKVLKKYFTNKNQGGDNWERLKYDRNQADDVFGFDQANKKDWTQRASDARWNEAFDANANAAESARAADAALGYNNQDWTKSAKGFQNAASGVQDRDYLKKYGVKAEDWKRDQDAAASDFAAQKANLWDTDAERNAVDARTFAAAAADGSSAVAPRRAALFTGGLGAGGVAGGAAAAGFGGVGAGFGGVGAGYGGVGGYGGYDGGYGGYGGLGAYGKKGGYY